MSAIILGLDLAIDTDYKPSVVKTLIQPKMDINEVDSVSHQIVQ